MNGKPLFAVELPWPPSVNRLYGYRGFHRFLSSAGRDFKKKTKRAVGKCEKLLGRLEVQIYAHPPDGKIRDLDNVLKITLDALQFSGVVANDYQFARIIIERREIEKLGCLRIVISTIERETHQWDCSTTSNLPNEKRNAVRLFTVHTESEKAHGRHNGLSQS